MPSLPRWLRYRALLAAVLAHSAFAQDPTGMLLGQVTDPSGAAVPQASLALRNTANGREISIRTAGDGSFLFSSLPVGDYSLVITASGFGAQTVSQIRIDVARSVNLPVELAIAVSTNMVEVADESAAIDVSPTLGNVVSGRDAVDLPLNGRNLTQLGLLQPGVAPLTAGLLDAGGIVRSRQGYAVNGQPPESNNYLLDGVANVDSVNGGFALRTPPDAVSEFRILTSNAPAEYGQTSGATTSVITKSGTDSFHGALYEFLRNDVFDARNFFAANTEPLHQHQFGATLGGPLRRSKDFFFLFYDGQRDRQGETRAAIVPTLAQRSGDFSGIIDPATGQTKPLINEFTGQQFPGNRIPASFIDPVAARAQALYPAGNLAPNLFSSTQMQTNNYDQGGFRLDHYFGNSDQLFARYATSSLNALDPLPVNGSNVPGFPIADAIRTHSFTLSDVHLFSPRTVQTVRAAFLRNVFLHSNAQNHTPASSLGFSYQPTLDSAVGVPFLIVSGYANLGNPITGPQDTAQTDFAGYYSLTATRGRHNLKFGADLDHGGINVLLGIATNGFFVFAPFPASDSFASFLLGQSVQFFQGGGDFSRGLRKWIGAAYVQDEWRLRPNLILSYGARYEVKTPYTEIRDRLNAWAPGRQSVVHPDAPSGLLFPGDASVPGGIAANYYRGVMPRVGLSWDPVGDGRTAVRAGYGIFYDGFTNGAGGPLQAGVSALPWTEAYQQSGPGFSFADPFGGRQPPFVSGSFVRPATVLTVDSSLRPPYSQNWNLSVQRTFGAYLLDVRYVGNKGTRLPRFVEANPSLYTPGATSRNTEQRRPYSDCSSDGSCAFGSVGLISGVNNSTYHALQIAFSRQFTHRLSFLASYWWSKNLDYVSSLNLAGSAPTLAAGENDLAQNPADLRAEHGLSLFDATHRFVLSGSYALPGWRSAHRLAGALVNGWQLNTIMNFSSGTPFTVYDSANVSLQGSAPEITGFYSSRPDLASDPNRGPHTPDQWISRTAFRPLDPVTEAGRFGNEGRNVVRGPGIAQVDASLFKNFAVTERSRLQFRAECFNLLNHANFGLPQSDVQSPAFGQILQAAPPRLLQLALKFLF